MRPISSEDIAKGPTPAPRRRSVSVAALVFALTVIAEIFAFVYVTKLIGVGWALLILVATSLLGGFLLKREGVRAWSRLRDVQAAGGRPGPHLTRAVVGLGASLLLVVPGFLTDIAGLLLLLPPVRAVAGRGVGGIAAKRLNPSLVGDLFGPRRVRVRTSRAEPTDPVIDTTPIEGEIVEDR